MPKTLATLAAALFAAGLALQLDAATSPASAACVVGVADWDVLNMRAGPSARYRKVGAIPARACGVRVQWRTCRGNWCRVRYAGRRGWVNMRYIDEGGDGYGGGPTLGVACVYNVAPGDVLWMRTGPGVRYRRDSSLPYNECGIRVIDKCRGKWCIVESREGATGWVNTRYLRFVR